MRAQRGYGAFRLIFILLACMCAVLAFNKCASVADAHAANLAQAVQTAEGGQ